MYLENAAPDELTSKRLPLLALAESQDVDVGYSCRAGSCGK
jgi:hypothetical protein